MSVKAKLFVFVWIAVISPPLAFADTETPPDLATAEVPETAETAAEGTPTRIGGLVNSAFQKLGDATGTRTIVDEVQCRTANTTWGELGAGAVAVGMGNVIGAGGAALKVNEKNATQECLRLLREKDQGTPVDAQPTGD